MFVGELSLRRWVSQAFPHELSNVVDSSILQDGIEDESKPNFSILNINLISIIELALLCSSVVRHRSGARAGVKRSGARRSRRRWLARPERRNHQNS